MARVIPRTVPPTAAIRHNGATGQAVLRSLIAHEHCPLAVGDEHVVDGLDVGSVENARSRLPKGPERHALHLPDVLRRHRGTALPPR